MSYLYPQYGEGFNLQYPDPIAMRFNELVQLKGETINIIQQTQISRDSYGQPVHTETSSSEHVFIEYTPKEKVTQAGHIKQSKIIFYTRRWAPIQETLHEIEIMGQRYHITGIQMNPAYLKITAERKHG